MEVLRRSGVAALTSCEGLWQTAASLCSNGIDPRSPPYRRSWVKGRFLSRSFLKTCVRCSLRCPHLNAVHKQTREEEQLCSDQCWEVRWVHIRQVLGGRSWWSRVHCPWKMTHLILRCSVECSFSLLCSHLNAVYNLTREKKQLGSDLWWEVRWVDLYEKLDGDGCKVLDIQLERTFLFSNITMPYMTYTI